MTPQPADFPPRSVPQDDGEAPIFGESGQREHPTACIVGRSRVNGVVVGRIVERCGLRALAMTPEEAPHELQRSRPCLVVLDGGADNRDCQDLLPLLAQTRAQSPLQKPAVILLSMRNPVGLVEADTVIDAIIAKPILPEILQPVVGRLRDRVLG